MYHKLWCALKHLADGCTIDCTINILLNNPPACCLLDGRGQVLPDAERAAAQRMVQIQITFLGVWLRHGSHQPAIQELIATCDADE
jgi:uncharacterized membrane protein YqaE (UPF0057 family)